MPSKFALSLLIAILIPTVAGAGGEIYGTIHTTDGRELTGPIRWDRNENFWGDFLDGSTIRERDKKNEGFNLSIFGLDLVQIGGDSGSGHRAFSIPFGHLRSIERVGDGALVTLKSGEQIKVQGTSTDLGHGMREVLIDDVEQGRVELGWWHMKKVVFRQSPDEGRDAIRLHATVVTGSGSYTGFIVLDKNESLTEDLLKGTEDGVDHEIPFANIREIDMVGSLAKLTLTTGETLRLRGRSGFGHGSVDVLVPGLATVELVWDDVDKMTFSKAPASPSYDAFDGGRKLQGTVTLDDGRSVHGAITWDLDESYTWQALEGTQQGIDYAVRFDDIHSIERVSPDESRIRMRNDEVLLLSGTNDVDDSNRGILVTDIDRNLHELSWSDVKVVEFLRP